MCEREACFPLNLPKPHLAQGTFKDDVLKQNCYHEYLGVLQKTSGMHFYSQTFSVR